MNTHPAETPIIDIPTQQPRPLVPNVITPHDLVRMAVEQGADLDRLERLFALKREYEADEARKAYYDACSRFSGETVEIFKGKRVAFETKDGNRVDYWHAELSDVCRAVDPALAAHGLSYRWNVEQRDRRVFVTCVLRHKLGHTESITMDGPPDESGKKNQIQQIQSTVTYLQRHTLLAITGKSTKGMDNDGRTSVVDSSAPTDVDRPDPLEELRQHGRDKSMEGLVSLTAWWGTLSTRQRTELSRDFGTWKRAAQVADQGVSHD